MTLRECIKQELKYPRKVLGSIVVYRVRRNGETIYTCAEWAMLENRPPVAEIWRGWANKKWQVSYYKNPTKQEKKVIDSFSCVEEKE